MVRPRHPRLGVKPRRRARNYSLEGLESRRLLAVLTVNSADDNDVRDEFLTLREAILVANGDLDPLDLTAEEQAQVDGTVNTGPVDRDEIHFAIPGAGPHYIFTLSQLPDITDPVVINGYTQAGASPNTLTVGSDAQLMISLMGDGSPGVDGLRITGGDTEIRGLAINQYEVGIRSANLGGNVIAGNYLGVDVDGVTAVGNSFAGIASSAPESRIGGTDPADRNVISGNADRGISGSGSGLLIQGNYIGTDASGTVAVPNGFAGIAAGEASSWTIGGTSAGAGNLISGNTSFGINLADVNQIGILGNLIGTDADGIGPIENGVGIALGLALNTLIGGDAAGASNTIAFNLETGVAVSNSASTVAILGNSIHSNGGLGIDLGDDGVTPNDDPDADGFTNYPTINTATLNVADLTVEYSFLGLADSAYRIEFYSSEVGDPTGFGEGRTYLGFALVATDAGGLFNGTETLPLPPSGESIITATATLLNVNLDPISTSEFSAWVEAQQASPASNDLSVTVVGDPNPVFVGDFITFTITVQVGDGDDVVDFVLETAVPDNVTFVSFDGPLDFQITTPNVGESGPITATSALLAAGSTHVFTLVVYTDPETMGSSTEVSVTANVSSATEDPDPENNTSTDNVEVTLLADLAVTIDADPSPVVAGQQLTYTIIVTNNGPSPSSLVQLNTATPLFTTFVSIDFPVDWVVEDAPIEGGTGDVVLTIPELAAGASAIFTLVVLVDPGTPGGTQLSATATVFSSGTLDPDESNDSLSVLTLVEDPPPSADLEVTKDTTQGPHLQGQELTYIIVVSNLGPDDAQFVILTDTLPEGVQFVSATDGVTPDGNGVLTFNIGTLASGAALQFEIVVIPTEIGIITNVATVTSDTDDPDPDNNTAAVETDVISAAANLGVTKFASSLIVNVGQQFTYTVTVFNNGFETADDVVLVDTLPASGITFVSATGDVVPDIDGNLVFSIGSLAFGESAVIEIVVIAAEVGFVTNTAVVTFDGDDADPSDNTASVEVEIVTTADLAVSMTAEPGTVGPGGEVTYTITVTNNGPNTADFVTLSTSVPALTTFLSFDAPNGWQADTPDVGSLGLILATIDSLASGESAMFTLVVLVDQGAADSSVLAGSATVTSDTPDPDDQNNTASAASVVVVPPVTETDVSVEITVAPTSVNPGQNLTYTITVRNNGVIPAADVNLATATPALTTFVSFVGPGGWTNSTPSVGGTGNVGSTIASLPAGAVAVFTLVVRVNDDAAIGSPVIATATVTTTTDDSDPDNNTASTGAQVTEPLTTNVTVGLVDDIDPATVGQTVTYTATVTNSGTGPAGGVVLTISVPVNAVIVSLGGGTQTANGVQFNIGTLDAGATQTFSIQVQAGVVGTQTLTASLAADNGVVVGQPATQSTTIIAGTNGDTTPPTVVDVVRYGFHAQATLLVVTFSEPMNPATAGNAANYSVVLSERDGIFGNADDRIVAIAQAFYDSSTNQVTLRVSEQIYVFRPFQLIVSSSVTDVAGNALDGNGDGTGGDPAVVTLDLSSVVGTAAEAPNAGQVGSAGPAGVLALAGSANKAKLSAAAKARAAKKVVKQPVVRRAPVVKPVAVRIATTSNAKASTTIRPFIVTPTYTGSAMASLFGGAANKRSVKIARR